MNANTFPYCVCLTDKTGLGNSYSFDRAFCCLYETFSKCYYYDIFVESVFGSIQESNEFFSLADFDEYIIGQSLRLPGYQIVKGSSLSRFGKWVCYDYGLAIVLFSMSVGIQLSESDIEKMESGIEKWQMSKDFDMFKSEFRNGVCYPEHSEMVIVNRDGILWEFYSFNRHLIDLIVDYHILHSEFEVEIITGDGNANGSVHAF